MKLCHVCGRNTPKLNLKKMKTYSSFHYYSLPLLLDATALNTKKGTTPKSVFKVLTYFNIGSSEVGSISVSSHNCDQHFNSILKL